MIADESRSLSGAEQTLVAVPVDPDLAASEIDELVVAATAGGGPASAMTMIPVEGAAIGEAFVQRRPGRFDRFDLAAGQTAAPGPA